MGSRGSTPQKNSVDIDQRLTDLDRKLESVRSQYEKYFTGLLKIEPSKEHREMKAMMGGISNADLKTTAAKFRHQAIQSRYLQLLKLWTKTLREIEEGTHKRELFLLDKKEEFKKLTQEQPRPDFAKTTKKTAATGEQVQAKYLDALYEKMKTLVPSEDKLPAKDSFLKKVGNQITELKAKHPDKKVELRLQKNDQGKVEVKIKMIAKS